MISVSTKRKPRKPPKTNAQKCKEYRDKQPKKLYLPLPDATRDCLAELAHWHGYEDRREAVAAFIHRLHELGPEGSKAMLSL